jgi:tetraacyldisaccharide 4'-kinase
MTGRMLRAPEFWWQQPGALSSFLSPLGALYGALAAARLAREGYRAKIPVLCIGNPTLGGAGKTPTAIAAGQILKDLGRRPCFLTRGYGGSARGPLLVDLSKHSARDVGDEALLLAEVAPTLVARDRAAGAQLAVANGADVIVMDDGFQNPSLAKDLSILVVDGARGLGNGRVFPAGPLRAPLAVQLSRAQAMLVIGDGAAGDTAAAEGRQAGLDVLRAKLVADAEAASQFKGKPVLAFAGIGDPEKFFRSLEAAGAEIAVRRAFGDHHRFSKRDAGELIGEAANKNLLLVTTEKDRARMSGDDALAGLRARALTLRVALAFEDAAAFKKLLENALSR